MLNENVTAESQKFNVLLAEDEPASQALMERVLKLAGHNVTIANNGQEALDCLGRNTYDVCVFDMQMPVMSGIEAVLSYKIKNIKSQLPFIMLTANTEKDAVVKCKNAGVDIFLSKPVNFKELIKVIDDLVSIEKNKIDSVIDITQLHYFEDQKFLDEYIVIFENSADDLLNKLSHALNNYVESMKIVHTIKGLSGNIGAHALRAITIEAESMSEDEYKNNADMYYKKITNELSKARKELVSFSSTNK